MLLHVNLYARYFQDSIYLLFRAASQLGIANLDEEIRAKGGEVEKIRGKTYESFLHLEQNENEAWVFKKYWDFFLHPLSAFFNFPKRLGLGILPQLISPEKFHSTDSD